METTKAYMVLIFLALKDSTVSYLWKIRESPPAYVFGTIHVSHQDIWPDMASNVKTVWRNSDKVYTELDMSYKQTHQEALKCRIMPGRRTLEDVLPRDVFQKLKQYFHRIRNLLPSWVTLRNVMPAHLVNREHQKRQLFKAYVGKWKRQRPIWILLSMNDLTEANVKKGAGMVVDEKLLSGAKKRGQETGALETARETMRAPKQSEPFTGR